MKNSLHTIMREINLKEEKLSGEKTRIIEEAFDMTLFLQELLNRAKLFVLREGFMSSEEEIDFFRRIKPTLLGKLIYYNKVYRIEASCPVDRGKMYENFYSEQFRGLKKEFEEHICNSDFYRYYRSGRTDLDAIYFRLGKINYHEGLNSFVFEIDPQFSTYYDYKVAKIIANDLLYSHLISKITPEIQPEFMTSSDESLKDLRWSDSRNALIEMIYAIYAAKSVSDGKLSIRKLSLVAQIMFKIPLNDLHHAFHRMKSRPGSRTIFLDHLKASLEDYMDRDL